MCPGTHMAAAIKRAPTHTLLLRQFHFLEKSEGGGSSGAWRAHLNKILHEGWFVFF